MILKIIVPIIKILCTHKIRYKWIINLKNLYGNYIDIEKFLKHSLKTKNKTCLSHVLIHKFIEEIYSGNSLIFICCIFSNEVESCDTKISSWQRVIP